MKLDSTANGVHYNSGVQRMKARAGAP